MSPAAAKKADLAAAHTVLPIAVPALAIVLDLPAGTEVITAVVEGDQLLITLAGVDWAGVRGWKARRGAKTPERITAEYSVDAHGHRSLTTLSMPAGDSGGIAEEPPRDPAAPHGFDYGDMLGHPNGHPCRLCGRGDRDPIHIEEKE